MTVPTGIPLQDGVYFEAFLPLGWTPVSFPIPSFTLEEWMQTNVTLLRALATMEALPIDKENEPGSSSAKAIDRLEAKVDLSLALLAKLLARDTHFPQRAPARLFANKMEWISQEGPEQGARVALTLFLSHKIPQALVLPANVTKSEKQPDGLHICATFAQLSEEMQDWLERTVFRYHRRSIQLSHAGKQS